MHIVSHTVLLVAEKAAMTVGKDAVKHVSTMVKHSLCKARNLFSAVFGESARKNS